MFQFKGLGGFPTPSRHISAAIRGAPTPYEHIPRSHAPALAQKTASDPVRTALRGYQKENHPSKSKEHPEGCAACGFCLPFVPRVPRNRNEALAKKIGATTNCPILECLLARSSPLTCSGVASRRVRALAIIIRRNEQQAHTKEQKTNRFAA